MNRLVEDWSPTRNRPCSIDSNCSRSMNRFVKNDCPLSASHRNERRGCISSFSPQLRLALSLLLSFTTFCLSLSFTFASIGPHVTGRKIPLPAIRPGRHLQAMLPRAVASLHGTARGNQAQVLEFASRPLIWQLSPGSCHLRIVARGFSFSSTLMAYMTLPYFLPIRAIFDFLPSPSCPTAQYRFRAADRSEG